MTLPPERDPPPVQRVAVAYLLRGEAAELVNTLRARYDPRSAAALPAHLTLAGPANVTQPVKELIRTVVAAVEGTAAFDIELGEAGTFLPVSATAFLEVSPGSPIERLHDRLIERLEWREAFPYHPHVTVAEYLGHEETARVFAELRGHVGKMLDRLDRLTFLRKGEDGRWIAEAECPLSQDSGGQG